jgi:hypothetical protein
MTELDEHIKQLCEERGYMFKPWETPPWEVRDTGPCPWSPGTMAAETWPQAQRLRRVLLGMLEGGIELLPADALALGGGRCSQPPMATPT